MTLPSSADSNLVRFGLDLACISNVGMDFGHVLDGCLTFSRQFLIILGIWDMSQVIFRIFRTCFGNVLNMR